MSGVQNWKKNDFLRAITDLYWRETLWEEWKLFCLQLDFPILILVSIINSIIYSVDVFTELQLTGTRLRPPPGAKVVRLHYCSFM